jgi:glutamate synthase domain-containing protein 2
MDRLSINLQETAQWGAKSLYIATLVFILLGFFIHPLFHIGTAFLMVFVVINLYFKHIQTHHTILRNFGLLGIFRYLLESIGPEMRQYFFSSDTEERPFNRTERTEVYRKAKDIDSTESFGSQLEFDHHEVKLKHSMFPTDKLKPYKVTFGDERKIKNTYTINKPMMISAMSFGSLGEQAIRSLSKGAKIAGIPMNTGEGGLSPYHLSGGADIIFQMGTAKFGVRNPDSSLNEKKLKELANIPQVKMIEIKFSQGAKPGKGGLLPKEKITEEIAKIRHVPLDQDVVSPPRHIECDNPQNTVKFIKKVQDISELPVGIKFCLGNERDFTNLIQEMKRTKIFPDYIAVDGAEGATGAAPKSFMDNVGIPLIPALDFITEYLDRQKLRGKLKIVASGKLINPGKQLTAMAHGADAVYTARGFMLALGCIQALQCNKGTCPVGITTHDWKLQRGIVVEDKANRVANYVKNLNHEIQELLTATGSESVADLDKSKLYVRPISQEGD